ncbi:MAG: hypothetical protein ABI220_04740 [Candidatus Saccharimonadales bacterium]
MQLENNQDDKFGLPEPSNNGQLQPVLPHAGFPVIPAMASVGGQGMPTSTVQSGDDAESVLTKSVVDKASEVIKQTANDPYLQNNQLSQLKAEYIKQRFNIDIKLGNG